VTAMRVWLTKAAIYLCAWLVAVIAAMVFADSVPALPLMTALLFLGVKFSVALLLGNFREMWRHTSLADLIAIVGGAIGSAAVLLVFVVMAPRLGSPILVGADLVLSVALLAPLRLAPRLYDELLKPYFNNRRRAVVLAGRPDRVDMELRRIHRQPSCHERVVGLVLDRGPLDGARLHRLRVHGRAELAYLLATKQVTEVTLVPPASASFVHAIQQLCVAHGVVCRSSASLLALGELMTHAEQLLARPAPELFDASVRSAIEGRTVLVTGAGGSIGSELCRQLISLHPRKLVLVNRSENGLFFAERSLCELNDGATEIDSHVLDVRDASAVQYLFARVRPDAVFHAAAHKHVPLMERHPSEAALNNIGGMRVTAEAAHGHGAEIFVFISSDKAVRPSSVMGATKRVGELFVRAMSRHSQTRFVSVRFGNVLGSNGSVLPLFIDQVQRGRPVTVTHPEMTRYFMSIPEACKLVLVAAARGQAGELFVLDMGAPLKIVELAERVIERAGLRPHEDVPVVFSQPRPGEKLAEQLTLDTEHKRYSGCNSFWSVEVDDQPLAQLQDAMDELLAVAATRDDAAVKRRLRELVPEYQPSELTLRDLQNSKGDRSMSETTPSTEANDPNQTQQIEDANGTSPPETEGEFRLTIRKLELPVRPRGVLAE
jgi:FlaA1/EpsC-like NDP-sugar epimerase